VNTAVRSAGAVELRCALCGAQIIGGYLQTELGEVFCTRHRGAPRCRCCGAPTDDARLCTGCASDTVGTREDVQARLPTVRSGLHALGLRLATPVRVRLVSQEELGHALGVRSEPNALGVTVSSGNTVVDLAVLHGLTGTEFGEVVAHEAMHAWLVQRGLGGLPTVYAEGLAEYTAYAWLHRVGDERSRMRERKIATNPDPVYGDGFRLVHAAADKYGMRAVLSAVRDTGRLPGEGGRSRGGGR
jgi:hypothetical protein